MTTTNESSTDERREEQELAQRQAEMRLEEWLRNGGMCGVSKGFAEASLPQYDPEKALIWRRALREGKWIFTFGPVGTGKTHLLSAITRSRFIWGWSCWFVYVPALLSELKRSFDGNTDESEGDILNRAMNFDLLCLDDLGTEKLTPWSSETLTTILNDRYATKRATVISSNYDLDGKDGKGGLAKRYERIADRIRERAVQVPLLEKRPERT